MMMMAAKKNTKYWIVMVNMILMMIKLTANRWAWELKQWKVGRGLMQVWGTEGRFPRKPCEREPALQVATNQHSHTEGTSVETNT